MLCELQSTKEVLVSSLNKVQDLEIQSNKVSLEYSIHLGYSVDDNNCSLSLMLVSSRNKVQDLEIQSNKVSSSLSSYSNYNYSLGQRLLC